MNRSSSHGTFPMIQVSGPPRQRGRQYGEQARIQVGRSIERYRAAFAHFSALGWVEALELAQTFVEPIEAFNPQLLEEMRGIAEGAGVETLEVVALNARTELMRRRHPPGAPSVPVECSSLAVLSEGTRDGRLLIGQNWDWLTSTIEAVVVLCVERDDGPNFVTVVEAGLLAKLGMNAAGLGVATNALVSDADHLGHGLPYHVILRALLDAESPAAAFAMLQTSVRSSSANFLFGGSAGLAVDVEVVPGGSVGVKLIQPDDGMLVHTNHFLAQPPGHRDVSLFMTPSSPFRWQRLHGLLRSQRGCATVEGIQAALADHADAPFSVCAHPVPHVDLAEQAGTLVSLVMEPATRRIWLADGPPCCTSFRMLECRSLLAPESNAQNSTQGR